jgi:hypothetical protein
MTAASGGARRDRTDDLMLAKHALSQLSYGPKLASSEWSIANGKSDLFAIRHTLSAPVKMVGLGGLEPPTSRLSSARSNQLSYKPELFESSHRRKRRLARPLWEERETKTAASRKDGLTGRLIPRIPVEKP